jgi:RNA polymerase sigma-70 factor (ECF subfamily)
MNLGLRRRRRRQGRARIAHFVAQLSVEQRAVLSRCFFRGWTTSQTATDLGLTDYTVKSTLHDALWTLLARSTTAGTP